MVRSILETDGYKFSMAEAGWPLRKETFYYSHRKGGPSVLPVDVRSFVQDLLPGAFQPVSREFLEKHEYEVGPGVRSALASKDLIQVDALPKGSWFFPGEPVFSVTGPSALVSWIEPLVLQLHYRIQVATLAMTDQEALARQVVGVTCKEQEEIILETLEAVEIKAPPITVDSEGYFLGVVARAQRLLDAVGGVPQRLFEVGMRSAICRKQHESALRACKELRIQRTSNVQLACELGMIPVGTMGHEHVQRYRSDEAAFRAMAERRPNRSSYLLDTFDVYRSGVPAALRMMSEDPDRRDSVRYDSGDKEAQYMFVVHRAKELGLRPIHIIEDELDDRKTRAFEELRSQLNVDPELQHYGYGGFIVCDPAFGELTRDAVSAAYKLSMSGHQPVMKFSAAQGKESLPGRPVAWRRMSASGPIAIVGQADEPCPNGYQVVTGLDRGDWWQWHGESWSVNLSPGTLALKDRLRQERDRSIMEASLW